MISDRYLCRPSIGVHQHSVFPQLTIVEGL